MLHMSDHLLYVANFICPSVCLFSISNVPILCVLSIKIVWSAKQLDLVMVML